MTIESFNWKPFILANQLSELPGLSPMNTIEGVNERLHSAAFAELQATYAFLWASQNFLDAPVKLREIWKELSVIEDKHFNMLLEQMERRGINPEYRKVYPGLLSSLLNIKDWKDFALKISDAEEKGRKAGLKVIQEVTKKDPLLAAAFQHIVDEEVDHVAIPAQFI